MFRLLPPWPPLPLLRVRLLTMHPARIVSSKWKRLWFLSCDHCEFLDLPGIYLGGVVICPWSVGCSPVPGFHIRKPGSTNLHGYHISWTEHWDIVWSISMLQISCADSCHVFPPSTICNLSTTSWQNAWAWFACIRGIVPCCVTPDKHGRCSNTQCVKTHVVLDGGAGGVWSVGQASAATSKESNSKEMKPPANFHPL